MFLPSAAHIATIAFIAMNMLAVVGASPNPIPQTEVRIIHPSRNVKNTDFRIAATVQPRMCSWFRL